MMSKQSGLGKGLDALLPTSESEAGDFFVCAIESIEPNPEQPRKLIDDEALRMQMSARARTKAESLSWKRVADEYLSLYGELVAGP